MRLDAVKKQDSDGLLSREKFDLETIWALASRTLDLQDGNFVSLE